MADSWPPPPSRPAPAPLPPVTPDPIHPRSIRAGAIVVALLSAGLIGIAVVIWALTTRGYFWPMWPALPFGLVTAIVGWIAWVYGDPARRVKVSLGVTITAGLYLSIVLFLTGIWAAAGGGYFWPAWPALGLAIILGVHALIAAFVAPHSGLEQRIATLTSTRSAAIDAQEAELRRIERDLHDGAQARLVALGMTIGMAEQKLDQDPEEVRKLLAEARGGAQQALGELRDLARGIRPPVLQDRGLAAAVQELAVRSPLEVSVVADVDRLPPAVESAAYFVVAESLTNATKHAQATRIDVRLERRDHALVAEVSDNGIGGANPNGSGLTGLRHRVEALDGTLLVVSPPGGPTSVRAEIPCGA